MSTVDHSSRAHALLSASGASRWINCTPSPRLEENFKDEESSYAQEGTLAHEFGDLALQLFCGNITKAKYNREVKKQKKNKLYTSEMLGQVEKYTTYIIEEFNALKAEDPKTVMYIEERLDLSEYAPHSFGTGDCIIIGAGKMFVIDLKYGKGVPVSAVDNAQLRLYGLGGLTAFSDKYEIAEVVLTIVQPRLDSISIETMYADDLLFWGADTVKPKALLAFEGKGEQVTGDWCRWCKAKPRCKALAAELLEQAKADFSDPELLTDDEMINAFMLADKLVSWTKAIKAYMLKEAKNGKTWKGLKVVEGKSQRRWTDEAEVIETLLLEGFDPEEIINQKIKGIGDISSLMSVDRGNEVLKPLIIKPSGPPTLVPLSDKRPARGLAQAKADFE